MFYLQKRVNGLYYVRISVPNRLRPKIGKGEIVRSLGVTDKLQAKLKALPLIEKTLIEFSTMTTGVAVSPIMQQGLTLTQVFEKYASEKELRLSTQVESKSVLGRIITLIGDKDIRTYSKADVLAVKDELFSNKRSSQTVKKYISLLKTLFSYSVQNDLIAKDKNPAEGITITSHRSIEPRRLPYSVEQIQYVLGSELFTKTKPRPYEIEYRFIILLGCFTGARVEEICRLHVADIGVEGNLPFAFIRPHKGENELKTVSSRRRVPLHAVLWLDWGLNSYVDEIRSRKEKFLFPILNRRKVGEKGSISPVFSKFYTRCLQRLGLSNQKLTFHSYRHTFKVFGRSNGLDPSLIDTLQGHSVKSVALEYGRDKYGSPYPLKTLYQAVMKIEELSSLLPPQQHGKAVMRCNTEDK